MGIDTEYEKAEEEYKSLCYSGNKSASERLKAIKSSPANDGQKGRIHDSGLKSPHFEIIENTISSKRRG